MEIKPETGTPTRRNAWQFDMLPSFRFISMIDSMGLIPLPYCAYQIHFRRVRERAHQNWVALMDDNEYNTKLGYRSRGLDKRT